MKPLTLLEWKLVRWMAQQPEVHSLGVSGQRVALNAQREPTADARRAARSLIAKRPAWFAVNTTFWVYRLNEVGQQAFAAEPRPAWHPPAPPALTAGDWEVLGELRVAVDNLQQFGEGWARTMDCGGSDGSGHSAQLVKLVRHGYAESRQVGGAIVQSGAHAVPEPQVFQRPKGSRQWRITPAGRAALAQQFAAR